MTDPDLDAALAPSADPAADAVRAVRALVAFVRPARGEDSAAAVARYAQLIERLEADPAAAAGVQRQLFRLFDERRLVAFFAESGILPPTGFFSELGRIVAHRLLPELPDERELRDAIGHLFNRRNDWVWLHALPTELSLRLWQILGAGNVDPAAPRLAGALDQMLEALLVLAYRIGGVDAEREFARLGPQFDDTAVHFRAVAGEAQRFVDEFRARATDIAAPADDERQLLVLVDQCRQLLQRARRASMRLGTSLVLTYLLLRSEQSLRRIETLAGLLAAWREPQRRAAALATWVALMGETLAAENRRGSLREHLARGAALLALRVTDNAAKTGEHYVADSRPALARMWRAAMGAGALIAMMALIKIFAAKLTLPLAGTALVYSLIYGLGFVLIYMLHWVVATKQPAMTAQTIANRLGELKPGRKLDLTPAVDLIVAVARTQFAAIVGNVALAVPTAIVIALLLARLHGAPIVEPGKGAHLLDDLDPLSWAPLYAAIAGVFLFLSGVLSGYFDNWASYARVGARVARLRWLRWLARPQRATRIGEYLEDHLGGLMGNFLFGCMLGSAGTIGLILGLPIDIRHIAFASANFGYALAAFDFALPWATVAWAALGVAVIGALNLTVSFALALWMALKARGVAFTQTRELLRALWARFRAEPASFFVARRAAESAG
jgi:site-specific recombinase